MGSRDVTRRQFLAAGAATLVGIGSAPACSRTRRVRTGPLPPNLLLIVSDDQAREDCGCYGNATIGTPSIDRLASEGLRFTRAFTPTAICQPSRSALHTGLHGTTSGADGFKPIKPGIATLPTLLRRTGYRTGLIGKTNVEPIEQFEFDLLKPSKEVSDGRDVDAIASCARAFIKDCASTRDPFFLNVNFDDPHDPWPLTPEEAERKMPEYRKRPKDGDPRFNALGGVAGIHDPAKVRLPEILPDRPEIRHELARYCDAITRLDRGVGLVLDVLEQERARENTVVLFLSDNGMAFPFHKITLWEGGVHLPLLVRWPGVAPSGVDCDGLVSFVDVMPTLLEIAGVPPPKLEGRSFRSALLDPKTPLRDEVFLTHTRHPQNVFAPSRGLRTTRWKYLCNFWESGFEFVALGMKRPSWKACLDAAKDDPVLAERVERYLHRPPIELYDLEADPLEKRNLARTSDAADVVAGLHERLRSSMAAIADPLLGSM